MSLLRTRIRDTHERALVNSGFYRCRLFILWLCLVIVGTSCEQEVIYRDQRVTLNFNPCIASLSLDKQSSCLPLDPSPTRLNGCFYLETQEGQSHNSPVIWTPNGLEFPNDSLALATLRLSEDPEGDGSKFGLYLFENESSCDAYGIDSVCEGECLVGVSDRLMPYYIEGNIVFKPQTCVWSGSAVIEEVSCDGVDNDCDGQIDEGLISVGAPCQNDLLGECANEGIYACTGGSGTTPTCQTEEILPTDEVCDGLDNDCNGAIDEVFRVGEPCDYSVGICRQQGRYQCVTESSYERIRDQFEIGAEVCYPEMTPVSPLQNEAGGLCNAQDDDCDGYVDEHYVSFSRQCGEGACTAAGYTQCDQGEITDTCRVGAPAEVDDNCDGVDDDCSGRADEDFISQARPCGVGLCARMGEVLCVQNELRTICTAGEPLPNRLDDDCNGQDEDCDGNIDESYMPTDVTCGDGACESEGELLCVNGEYQNTCQTDLPSSDSNCDGVDNDCDSRTDEAFTSEARTCGQGVCEVTGQLICDPTRAEQEGAILICTPLMAPTQTDACDGLDNDCDGVVDEGHFIENTICGRGVCEQTGRKICTSGSIVNTCVPLQPSTAFDSLCNATDEDCDGIYDEDYPQTTVLCGDGACRNDGITICLNGIAGNTCRVNEIIGDDSNCDGVDDDCDGQLDESYITTPTNCGLGICARTGEQTCFNGTPINTCNPGVPLPNDTTCNDQDEDCDGREDEGYPNTPITCGQGVCIRPGLRKCESGSIINDCLAGQPTGEDQNCDSLDNDCDNDIDEDYSAIQTECGIGACFSNGLLICTNNGTQDTCDEKAPALNDRTCNGVDDDCNGETDDGYLTRLVTCGQGVCTQSVYTQCVNGEELDTCIEGSRDGDDDDCNQVDDDCDGSSDESYIPESIICSEDACVANGEQICTTNGFLSTCAVGAIADDDVTCNAIDDDCDGALDEDYLPPQGENQITCGQGVCFSDQGALVCQNGGITTECTPLMATIPDDNCDGADDDCDGLSDEHYIVESTCGIGECASIGEERCVNAGIQDSCIEGSPTPEDLCGDLKDNDCDGNSDEGYENLGIACTVGQGECERTGTQICASDLISLVCSVTPGSPIDELCDDLDNDCDNQIDEEIPTIGDLCNVQGEEGACAEGLLICNNQSIECEGNVSTDEIACDDIDQDCDGTVDEVFVEGYNGLKRPNQGCGGGCKFACVNGVMECRDEDGICN